MTAAEDDDAGHWTTRAVSWAHLLIACGSVLVSMGGVIVSTRLSDEKRLVQLEERQQMVLSKNIEQDTVVKERGMQREAQLRDMRDEMNRRFDIIQANQSILQRDITALQVSSALGDLRKQNIHK